MKKIFTLAIFSVLLSVGLLKVARAQQSYYYDFRNTLNEVSSQGPVLNVIGTGAFVNEGLLELSCISRPVYGFTQNSGIQFDNTAAGNFITESYSIEMYFQFLNNSGFKRVIDYSNQGSDSGLYVTATQLLFYDELTIPTTAFVANQYVHLVVTRDSTTQEINFFIDGVQAGSFIDNDNVGVLNAANVLNFFQDDTISGGEARPGRIALLKLYNTAIDGNAVAASFSALEATSQALSFTPDQSAACLSGNVFNFTNTSLNAGGLTYNWEFGDGTGTTGTDASHSYLTDTTYTVLLIADDGLGCVDSVSASVVVYPQPIFALGNDTSVCDGFSVTLDAGSGFSAYLWSDSTTNQTLTASVSGIYSVSVTDTNGCSSVDSVEVTIILPPAVVLGPDTTLCFGTAFTISGPVGEASYLWSTGDTTESIVVTSPGVYAVEVANTFGCIASDTVEIFYYPQLALDLGQDASFCIGDTLILDADSGYVDYVWNDNSTQQTLAVFATGTYFVTVKDSIGCEATDSINIIVNSLPVVDLGPDATLCGGNVLTIDAGGPFVNYLWNDGSQAQTLDVTTANTYSVIVTDSNGCAGTDDIVVVVTPLVDLGPDLIVCDGVISTLDAGAGLSSYLWSDGSSGQTLDVSVTGIYTVTVTDLNGCINSDEISVAVNLPPVIDLGPDVTTCSNNPAILDPGAGFFAYLWSDGSTLPTLSVSTSGTYIVTVSSAPNCDAQDTINVTVFQSPVIDLGIDTVLCDGVTVTLDAGAGYSFYFWNDGSVGQTLDATASGIYSVVVTDSIGCTGTDTISLLFDPLPFVELGPNQDICAGTATVLDAGAGFASYLWNDGTTAQFLLASTAGTYTVTVSNSTGCSTIDSVTINILPAPVLSLGADTTLCDSAQLTLDAGAGFNSYIWSDGTALQTLTVSVAGNYAVTITDANGCSNTDDIEVSYFAPVPAPVITQNVNTLQSSPGTSYQWYIVPGGIIPGEINQTFSPAQNGTYYVVVTDSNGCQSPPSPDFIFVLDGIATTNGVSLLIAPNPANSSLTIETVGIQSNLMMVEVIDMLGKSVAQIQVPSNEKYRMDIASYPEGIYFVKVSGPGFSSVQKLIISR